MKPVSGEGPTVFDRPGPRGDDDTEPIPEDPRAPGTIPHRYRGGDEIARGGMGRVIEATDVLLGRTVALKEALATDSDALRRFAREVRITARLEHPSIIPVYDAGATTEGSPFYVMRKVTGEPLERVVADAETLNERLALLPHVVAAAQAIAHAHERGIVHRDIKPSNILVGSHGETIVIDWGLAKVVGEVDDSRDGNALAGDSLRTRHGAVFGTPGFMSPEQLESTDVDERSDVYALGATLYYLLARRAPHAADSGDEMMTKARKGPPTPLDDLVRGVPRALSTIVDKAMAYDPDRRYRTAGAVAEELSRFLAGQLVAAHRYSTTERLARFVRRHRALVITVAAALSLLAAGAWYAVGRIVSARDDAVAQAHAADEARAREADRAMDFALSQARLLLATNPTAALGMVRPFAGSARWREVRAIAAGARAAGVPWRLEGSAYTTALAIAPDGVHAASCGSDGVVRVHDLAARTSREATNLGAPCKVAFIDDRTLAAWQGTRLVVVGTDGRDRRSFDRPTKLAAVAAGGGAVYGADDDRRAWRLDLSDPATGQLAPLDVAGVRAIVPAPTATPDRVAFATETGLWLATGPAAPVRVAVGKFFAVGWAADGRSLVATRSQGLVEVALGAGAPAITEVAQTNDFALRAGGMIHTIGITGRWIGGRPVRAADLGTAMLGLHRTRGDLVVNGSPGAIHIYDGFHLHELVLPASPLVALAAAPQSPYIVAGSRELLLVWNVDDIMPRRHDAPRFHQLFTTGDHDVWTVGFTGATRWLDALRGTALDLPAMSPVRAASTRSLVLLLEPTRLYRRGSATAEPLPIEPQSAGFLDDHRLAYSTRGGQLAIYDVDARATTVLVEHHAVFSRLGVRAQAPGWIVAATDDNQLLRYQLPHTGKPVQLESLASRTTIAPKASFTGPTADGRAYWADKQRLLGWSRTGEKDVQARLPRPILYVALVDDHHALVMCDDFTGYLVSLDVRDRYTSTKALDAQFSSSETGLVAIENRDGGVWLVDVDANASWMIGKELPSGGTPAITHDGRAVVARGEVGGEDASVLVWRLDLPSSPAETERWIAASTNAGYDLVTQSVTWP